MADQIHPFVEERMYIGGVLRPAEGGKVFDNVSPVTEQVIGVCADASGPDMEDAIAAAQDGVRRRVLVARPRPSGPLPSPTSCRP